MRFKCLWVLSTDLKREADILIKAKAGRNWRGVVSLCPGLCHCTGQSTAEQNYMGLGLFEAGLSRDMPEQRTPRCKKKKKKLFIGAILMCSPAHWLHCTISVSVWNYLKLGHGEPCCFSDIIHVGLHASHVRWGKEVLVPRFFCFLSKTQLTWVLLAFSCAPCNDFIAPCHLRDAWLLQIIPPKNAALGTYADKHTSHVDET